MARGALICHTPRPSAHRRLRALVTGTALSLALLLVGITPTAGTIFGHGAPAPRSQWPPKPRPKAARARKALIAFRDAAGIGVIDPESGQEHLLISVPSACNTGQGGTAVTIAGPVWAPPSGPTPDLFFWLTDWALKASVGCRLPQPPSSLAGAPLLVQADPLTGALRVVAVAPRGLPCQPGIDLVAVKGALGFTDGSCDETSIEALAFPLRSAEEPLQPAGHVPPSNFCRTCAISARLLGAGPGATVLFEELGLPATAVPPPPPPSLQLFDPVSGAVRILAFAPPPNALADLAAAASAPSGNEVAFAGEHGVGVLDLSTGAWSSEPVPPCRRTDGACFGPGSVAFSPSGRQLAIATGGELRIDPVSSGTRTEVLLPKGGVRALSWSGPVSPTTLRGAGPWPLASALRSLFAPFVASGTGASEIWQVGPALPAGLPVLLGSLPGTPSALLMVSDRVALAAGRSGTMWRSTNGGHTWTTLSAHCAALAMVSEKFPPCDISHMAALTGGVLLAGGPLGLWRSIDQGLAWQRETFPGRLVEEGPWSAGSIALVLVEPATPSGTPRSGAGSSTLLASSDGGRIWRGLLAVPRRDPDPGSQAALFDQLFVLGSGHLAELYQVGDCSRPADLRVSADNGKHWRSVPVGPRIAVSTLTSAKGSRLVLGSAFCGAAAPLYGQGIFARPLSRGASWSAVQLPAGYLELGLASKGSFPASSTVHAFSIGALVFTASSQGIAVGSQLTTVTDSSGVLGVEPPLLGSQLIFESRDGGLIWSQLPAPGAYPLTMLSCADATHCLAAGSASDELVLLSPGQRSLGRALAVTSRVPVARSHGQAVICRPLEQVAEMVAVGVEGPLAVAGEERHCGEFGLVRRDRLVPRSQLLGCRMQCGHECLLWWRVRRPSQHPGSVAPAGAYSHISHPSRRTT